MTDNYYQQQQEPGMMPSYYNQDVQAPSLPPWEQQPNEGPKPQSWERQAAVQQQPTSFPDQNQALMQQQQQQILNNQTLLAAQQAQMSLLTQMPQLAPGQNAHQQAYANQVLGGAPIMMPGQHTQPTIGREQMLAFQGMSQQHAQLGALMMQMQGGGQPGDGSGCIVLKAEDVLCGNKNMNGRPRSFFQMEDITCGVYKCERPAYSKCGDGLEDSCYCFTPCGKFLCDQHIQLIDNSSKYKIQTFPVCNEGQCSQNFYNSRVKVIVGIICAMALPFVIMAIVLNI